MLRYMLVIKMKLIVGLGNPGSEYANTRHNMGYSVIDILLDRWNETLSRTGFKGRYVKTRFSGEEVVLLKPETYMNLSGECVFEFMNYFHIDDDDLLVIYDDLDLPPGKIRLREKGSSGGQKGMQNIINLLHTEDIQRIRIGIGKSSIPVVDYVLGKPSKEDLELIKTAQNRAADAVETFIKFGFERAKAKFF